MTTASVPFVDLGAEYRAIAPEIQRRIERVLLSAQFVLGEPVQEFEEMFAEFVQTDYAIGVSSGLDALRLTLHALDVGPADEVIVPANSFIATALAVTAVGARPVLVDCDPETYNIDAVGVEKAISPRTRAIIPVHLTGLSADMAAILDVAERQRLYVVEDAAQAHGTLYRGRPCGSLGTAGCFSFYPSKNLGAYGDAGMVVTNSRKLADRLRCLRNYGQIEKHVHIEKGLNARLDGLQAAVLAAKLPHLREWNRVRASHAAAYRAALDGVGDIGFQKQAPYLTHVYHLFVIETGHRESLRKHLAEVGIMTGVHYPVPIHRQPAYRDLGYRAGDFPNSERLAERVLSLPMFPQLRAEQLNLVVERIREFFKHV